MKRYCSESTLARLAPGERGNDDAAPACAALIMAAGKGTRMKSDLPKVLHPLAGRELIRWVLGVARDAGLGPLVLVLGHQAERVQEHLRDEAGLRFVIQMPQNGTGHAVQVARPQLVDLAGDLMVLSGDTPLLRSETLLDLLRVHREREAAATVLTAELADPTGYGRILRDGAGDLAAIREHRDASAAEREVCEINSGTYCFRLADLLLALESLRNDNDQGEYYLTDTLEILRDKGLRVAAHRCADPHEIEGVNDREQLAAMERQIASMREGR